jgi:hypothetical protein
MRVAGHLSLSTNGVIICWIVELKHTFFLSVDNGILALSFSCRQPADCSRINTFNVAALDNLKFTDDELEHIEKLILIA